MVLDNTNRAWLKRYYTPKSPKLINQHCEFCGEQLTTNYFLDITGLKFCNRSCFNATRSFRDSSIFLKQKAHDSKHFNHRPDTKQKGR